MEFAARKILLLKARLGVGVDVLFEMWIFLIKILADCKFFCVKNIIFVRNRIVYS